MKSNIFTRILTIVIWTITSLGTNIKPVNASNYLPATTTDVFYLPWENNGTAYKVSRAGSDHQNAIDFVLPKNTPILSATNGRIEKIEERYTVGKCDKSYSNLANYVRIKDDKGELVYYYHLAPNSVPDDLKVGDYIHRGTLIGKSGNTGYSCGYHLHFQVKNKSGTVLVPRFADVGGSYVRTGQWYKSQNVRVPGAPTLTSPGNTTNVFTDTVFKWAKTNYATEYYIEYAGPSSGNSGWINTTSFAANLLPGEYTWRVRARNSKNITSNKWSQTWSFSVQLAVPIAPTLSAPASGTATNSSVYLAWNTVPDAAEYYLEFAGPTSGNSGWITATTFPVTSLPAGAYTWHVKARNNGVESAWSQTWNFTVQPTINAPEAPTLSYPTENGNTSADVTFVWNSVPNATEYFIEYTGTFSSGNSGWISETTFPVTALPAGNYAWSVKARNGSSESDWSPTWSFAVQPSGDVPAPPTLSFPAENGTVPIDFTFAWNSVPDAIEYFMEYNGTAASGNSGWGASTSFPVTALPAGTYTWSVMARNSNGESGWSPTWAFTVEPVVINIPAAPTLTSPVNGTGSGSAVTLSWQSVSDAVEYYAEYSGASSGNSGWINGTSLPLTSLPAGAYTWKVKARNAGGESEWSVPWSFTVTTAPVAPILLLPADNATVVAASLSFSWNSTANATAYYFEYSGAMSGNSGWVTSTTAQIATPVNGVYTWRVKARNAGGESVWSQTRTVTFVSTPSQITINSPTTIYPTGACSTSNWMTFTNNLSHTYYVTQNNNINPWAANPNYTYWKASIPVAGRYKVEAYIPSHGTLSWCGAGGKSISANTTDAHYQIYTSGTTWTKVEKSQNIGGNVWLNLGEFQLANGNYNVVKLIDSNHQTSYSQLIFFSDIRITWVGQ